MNDRCKFLIVGGSSGIGLATVRRLAAAHHEVCVASRTCSAELREIPGVEHLEFDATADSLEAADLPGHLDGLAYFPGTINLRPFVRLSREEFQADLDVNLLGAVNVIQSVLPLLLSLIHI